MSASPRRDFLDGLIPPERLTNLAAWAQWDADGRTPNWAGLRGGLASAANGTMTATEAAPERLVLSGGMFGVDSGQRYPNAFCREQGDRPLTERDELGGECG
jgi:hypothetical protein